eukprot:GHVR01157373.1.p1 GENE.GHVR01157373.1~~GHVR01157373.1.p1  ORF type:complete len:180 (+),score=38.02 GHVR01157373.1:255-794(+)
MSIRNPNVNVTIHARGTMMMMGYTDPTMACVVLKQIAKRLRDKLSIPIRFSDFQVKNFMAVGALTHSISLPRLRDFSLKWVRAYNPEQSAALKLEIPVRVADLPSHAAREAARNLIASRNIKQNINNNNNIETQTLDIQANVYSTGKIGITGPAHEEVLNMGFSQLLALVNEFRKKVPR